MKMIESTSALLGERYVRFLHSCGLPVYVFPKKMSSTFAFFAVRYGSCDDVITHRGKEKTVPDGIAHFLEHKLFESEDGTDTFARFAALGADPNAYTAFDRTAYFFSCTDRFEESLGETPATVVATGGASRLICPACRHTIVMDDTLLLKGLWQIWKRNSD